MKHLAIAAALIATPAVANECKVIKEIAPVVGIHPRIGPNPVLLGIVIRDFDTTKKTACYSFTGNKAIGIKISPNKFCFDVGGKVEKTMSPMITLADGTKVTAPPMEREEAVKEYSAAVEDCRRPRNPPIHNKEQEASND